MKRKLGIIGLAFALPLVAVAAEASPITVSFSSASTSPASFFGDKFSVSGLSGVLNLDTSVSKTVTVNVAKFDIVDYTWDNGGFESQPVTLGFALTLGGVTHDLTQTGTWSITPTWDSMLTFNSVAPVLFNTPDGSWNIRLLGFAVGGGVLGSFSAPIQVEATPTPTPEPATLLLLGVGMAGGGIQRWRKRKTIV